MNLKARAMQSSIEVFLDHYNGALHDLLKTTAHRREHAFEYAQVGKLHSYCVILGRDYWNHYRNKLIKYVQEHFTDTEVVIEFDRQGDCRDKNIRYTYKGGDQFFVEYKGMELSYTGYFNIAIADN